MTENQTITRRALLMASPAILTFAAVPALASTSSAVDADAEFRSMFAAWRTAYVLANDNYDDAECEKLWAIEDRMATMRPTTLAGFAIKLLVMTSYDEFDLDSDRAKTLFADAMAITALPPPVLQRREAVVS